MRHPKNHTRFKSLDRIAADPRVGTLHGIWDEGPDGIWIELADGYTYEDCTCLHEWTVRNLLQTWKDFCLHNPTKE